MKITADTIRVIRQVYRLTLEDMAALMGTSTVGVWRIEHGERGLTADMISAVKREFELTDDKLAQIYEIYRLTGGRPSKRVRKITAI